MVFLPAAQNGAAARAGMVYGAKRIRSHSAPGEIRISNLEIRNKFKAPISNVQNGRARVWVI
jgi:hypothetical protein